MKKYTTFLVMAVSLITTISMAQTTGSAFSYQGELLDNGSPANGDYAFLIVLYDVETTGEPLTEVSFADVPVVNGLFNLEIDFGDVVYENNTQYYFEIQVVSSGGGSFTTLTPRHKLLAVPYAVQAQYGTSPWVVDGAFVSTLDKVGIGTASPSDRLHVSSPGSEGAFRVQVEGATKIRVHSNGGTSIGVNTTPPENGLFVEGDAQQDVTSQGMLKYMLRANCDATPTVMRQYNGTKVSGTASIVRNTNLTCDIIMPFDVSDNYISVTPRYINPTSERYANCNPVGDTLTCRMFSGAGNNTAGAFDILVY